MMVVWLMHMALLGNDPGDIRFLNPTVEFPTEWTCREAAVEAARRLLSEQQSVIARCEYRIVPE